MTIETDKAEADLKGLGDFQAMLPVLSPTLSSQGLNLDDVVQFTQSTVASAIVLGMDLESLFKIWDQFYIETSNERAEFLFRELLINITAISQDTKTFRNFALSLQVAAEESSNNLNEAVNKLTAQLPADIEKSAQLQTDISQIIANIRSIQQELSGSSGFWKGFEQGVSLGIYHPVNDSLNQQRTLCTQLQQNYQLLQQNILKTQSDTQKLQKTQCSLNLMMGLSGDTVSLENLVLAISGLAAKTEQDGVQLSEATRGRVAEFFRNRFDKDMSALLEWRAIFI